MDFDKKIAFEPGDIVIISRVIPWSNISPQTITELPFLCLENFCQHCISIDTDPEILKTVYKNDLPIHINRWKGLIEEKVRIFSWPSCEEELLVDYKIYVHRVKTNTNDIFIGRCQRMHTGFAKSIHTDRFTGFWRAVK